MIHCLAGAHRAGTATTAWLMYAHKMTFKDAIKLAKSKRSCIDPIGDFSEVLQVLEEAMKSGSIEELRKNFKAVDDIKAIHAAIAGKG
mmetsp:Transcript_4098/g.3551  ORF Transcript_4098/g.3551 Transcript_4098/m.3551 type:complete len:88 (+) Transcript_4098:323-586(+)